MRVTAIVLAAGKGERFKRKFFKPLFEIGPKPILIYSLEVLCRHPAVRDIIVAVNSLNRRKIIAKLKEHRITKVKGIVLGGRRRQDSVMRGLAVLDKKTDFVLIHDAARPFITQEMVSAVIRAAKAHGAAIAGIPVKATIKEAVGSKFIVKRTLDRKNLWEIQTPQVFKKDLILKAYKKLGRTDVTDDASLVEKLGRPVRLVLGSQDNIKITTLEDATLACFIARHRLKRG